MWPRRKRIVILAVVAVVLAGVVGYRYLRSPEGAYIEQLRSGATDERVTAIHALERIGSRRAVEAIAGAVSDPETVVACHAVLALGRLARPVDLDRVLAALNGDRQEVRAAAAYALSGFGDRADVDLLIRLLADRRQPAEVRAAAARSLGRLKVFRATPSLMDALEDSSLLVRARAYAAFRQIVGAGFDFHAADPPRRRQAAIGRIRRYYPLLKARHAKNVRGRSEGRS